MKQLPEAVRRSLSESDFDWRTAEGVAKDAGLPVTEIVALLESSPEISRAASPNRTGKALYRLKPKEPLLSRLIGAFANTPA